MEFVCFKEGSGFEAWKLEEISKIKFCLLVCGIKVVLEILNEMLVMFLNPS